VTLAETEMHKLYGYRRDRGELTELADLYHELEMRLRSVEG
jgi:hypothetical protein